MKEIKLPKQTRKWGYTGKEVLKILKQYNIKEEDYNEKFGVNTCSIDEDGEVLYYACDIKIAIRCCIEKRDKYQYEWD